MNLAAPSSVQKWQTALHDKAQESPKRRFHALYDKVYRRDVLAFAYECCKANGGAAGVDGQSFEGIEEYGVERWLDELTEELKSRTYRPTGRWKRRQYWYSNRSSRLICSRSSTPIDKTTVHWTP